MMIEVIYRVFNCVQFFEECDTYSSSAKNREGHVRSRTSSKKKNNVVYSRIVLQNEMNLNSERISVPMLTVLK